MLIDNVTSCALSGQLHAIRIIRDDTVNIITAFGVR